MCKPIFIELMCIPGEDSDDKIPFPMTFSVKSILMYMELGEDAALMEDFDRNGGDYTYLLAQGCNKPVWYIVDMPYTELKLKIETIIK